MGLSAGTRLGPYEITAPLGSGGMGEVYRARDTRLDRTVAIKVLSSSLASSPELKQRFEREARAVSKLNHPHICTLYDIGQQEGTDYLVMEFLEGESLAERVRRGSLPSPEVLKIGIEIADALDKAHRIGIVHRDIKPGNIMLTPSGGAKLLDFGLAKPLNAMASAASSSGSAPSFTAAPTLTSPSPVSPLTTEGTILGTVQYMSPEQIEGKEADARSDIFSFGAVLYELATGKRAFQGKSQLKVASAILEDDPQPATAIQPNLAPALNHVIATCLAKDPENRFQSAADVKLQLKWATQTAAEPAKAPIPDVPLWRRLLPWTVSAVCTIAAVLAIFTRQAEAPQYSTHAYILPPEKAELQVGGIVGPYALSPDGRRFAFVAHGREQPNNTIWVQALNSPVAQQLTGTDGASSPFWSPDSRYIGFFADGKLKKIDANGGPPQTLCDADVGRGGTWSPNGAIVFAATPISGLSTVHDVGGTPAEATQLSASDFEQSHRWPHFLPDGKHFLYFARSSSPEKSGIFVGLLGSKERRLVLSTPLPGIYANGYLLFLRESTLMAQPFNPDKLEVTGNAVPLAEQVFSNEGSAYGLFSASDNGVLALHAGGANTARFQLAWLDRSGKPQGPVMPDAAPYLKSSLSPDGSRLAFGLGEGGKSDIWVLDLKRQTRTRITFGPWLQANPVWTPDGKYIIYSSVRSAGTVPHIYKKAADGSGTEETVLDIPANFSQIPTSISRDGRYLVYGGSELTAVGRLWALPLFGERKPFLLSEPRPGIIEGRGSISPDGKWLAYSSTESGTSQIYLKPFPQGTAKWQVSTSGGARVAWRADGKELFFLSGTSPIMAVDFAAENGTPRLGMPHALFRAPLFINNPATLTFDITPDGQRFILLILPNTTEGTTQRITLI